LDELAFGNALEAGRDSHQPSGTSNRRRLDAPRFRDHYAENWLRARGPHPYSLRWPGGGIFVRAPGCEPTGMRQGRTFVRARFEGRRLPQQESGRRYAAAEMGVDEAARWRAGRNRSQSSGKACADPEIWRRPLLKSPVRGPAQGFWRNISTLALRKYSPYSSKEEERAHIGPIFWRRYVMVGSWPTHCRIESLGLWRGPPRVVALDFWRNGP